MISQEELKKRVDYDPETGIFRWRLSTRQTKPGKIAGHFGRYHTIVFDKKRYYAQRLAWLYMYNEWPSADIDHIDRNKFNNCIANLRLATRSENLLNSGMFRHNRSGTKGIIETPAGTYRARLAEQFLGTFNTLKEAEDARAAAIKLRGQTLGIDCDGKKIEELDSIVSGLQ